jgi:hypothetical protein
VVSFDTVGVDPKVERKVGIIVVGDTVGRGVGREVGGGVGRDVGGEVGGEVGSGVGRDVGAGGTI